MRNSYARNTQFETFPEVEPNLANTTQGPIAATSKTLQLVKSEVDFRAVQREIVDVKLEEIPTTDQLTSSKSPSSLPVNFKTRDVTKPIKQTLLQEWEGAVTSIDDEGFCATLTDVTANANIATETAIFAFTEISEDDKDLVELGAVFRWSICNTWTPSGTKRRFSQIVFRRMPAWTKSEIKLGRQKAREAILDIKWE